MYKKRQSSPPKKKTGSRISTSIPKRNWRPLILIGLMASAVLIVIALNAVRGPAGPSARTIADKFVGAMNSCDATIVQKYAPLIAQNEEKMAKFTKNCQPGMITATFVNESHVADQGALLTYSVVDASQSVYKKQTVLLTMIQDDNGMWEVAFVNGFLTP